tara:strand:+ start:816 stop:1250 length:435 start_codon:yes stop_codon:yes gene_type:complete
MVRTNKTKQEFYKKYFTIEEAERLLPVIERNLRRAIKLNKALDLLSSIEIEVYDDDYENLRKVTKANKQFHKLSYEFYLDIEKLEDMGCIVKDYEMGIVDFYHRLQDKDIFLCWKVGEKSIRFWHDIDAGFMGRKPILDLTRNK